MSWLADRLLTRFSLLTAGECYFLAINQRTVKVKMRTAVINIAQLCMGTFPKELIVFVCDSANFHMEDI